LLQLEAISMKRILMMVIVSWSLLACLRSAAAQDSSPQRRGSAITPAADQPQPAAQPDSPRRRRGSAVNQPATPPQNSTPGRLQGGTSTTDQPQATIPMKVGPPEILDYTDPTYGAKIRQLRKDDGHEHNFYYYRDPWNADGTYMLGIQSDQQQKNWHVVLFDGDGLFVKDLYTTDRYDWRLCWDRKNPEILYTWKASDLYRFNVKTGQAESIRSFKPLWLETNGPSISQDGDRILVITNDKTLHSYHLPDVSDERTFKVEIPPGCQVGWDKPHYTGYRNTIDVAYSSPGLGSQGIMLYDDTGRLLHRFEGIGGGGHYSFSRDGRLAYFLMPNYPRSDGRNSLDIHVVNVDGSDDHVLYSVSQDQAKHVQNLHVAWPAQVSDWFVASVFHFPGFEPPTYAPPVDEILQIRLDGTWKYLARTGGKYSRGGGRGSTTDMFWAMPLATPEASGKRISFNSNRSGTIDQYILYMEPSGK
jgi:hypothetical protein